MTAGASDQELLGLTQATVEAVLYCAYSDEANGGRESADESADHDYAYDRREAAFAALVEFGTRRERERLINEVRGLLRTANAEVEAAKAVLASQAAGSEEWHDLARKRGTAGALASVIETIEKGDHDGS